MRARDLDVLGFPKILEALAALAVSTPGAEICRLLAPLPERAVAEQALARQWGFFRLLEVAGPLPLAFFPDIRESLALARREGAVLPVDRLVEIRTVLRQVETLRRFLAGKVASHPVLADLPRRLRALPELEAALSRMLDDAGLLRDDASPRLGELRAATRDLRQDLEERLGRLVAKGGEASGIADRYVTIRNNRFVVPIRASTAARTPGVVQDRSASGETLFVEPMFAIDLNNRLLLLRKEEEQEEQRLLLLLTAQVGAVRDEIGRAAAALADVDALHAGVLLARRLRATSPAFGDGTIDLRRARHPELVVGGQAVVPIDIRLERGKRALVVSGPNTGGKTVALKTLGLLTLMARAGILIPADEGSVVPWVEGVFTDLADDQSIERNLSTFSSHVLNLVDVFTRLAPPALVLLDEPGGGTDPEEGAALAVALVDRLIARGVLVGAATHYALVKLYALNEPRAEVVAVDVDPVSFTPRYRLVYGSVGESLGLAMARRLRLPVDVIDAADAGRATAVRVLADAIAKLEESRRRHENERAALEEERRALAELESRHAALVAELTDRRRQRWASELDEARAFVRALKAEGRAVLEAVRRRGPEASRTLAEFGRKAAAAISDRAGATQTPEPDDEPPALGDNVEVRGTSIRGELFEIQGETGRLRSGGLTFQAPIANLRRRLPDAPPAGVTPRPHRPAATDEPASELHLVGMRVREALGRLEHFLDQAQGAGLPSVRIVHGLGTGALKRAVTEFLARTAYATAFQDAEPSAGGPGVTVASLL
ncbi:MAG: Smr/MutS family protein [Deltaproteobacteria bacterium]|nr:Smr/MutS family protein [Deltaproteobacteria bacterium]